jgi:hypothetical protein
MNEKQPWTGIAPSPTVLARLDYEEMAILALLSWSTATNRPVTSADVAGLADRDGKKIGATEAREIVHSLMDMKIVSVFGMNNDRPMSVRLGGFQSRTPRRFMEDRRPGGQAPRSVPSPRRPEPQRKPGGGPRKQGGTPPWVLKERRVETGLEITGRTPSYVQGEAAALRSEQVSVEGGAYHDDLVGAARVRLGILLKRISLYERWLKDEPTHPSLAAVLEKKRKAVPEMEFQIERAKVKQAELESSDAV